MKLKIKPINLICHNDELLEISVYHLKENLYKVTDSNSKLSFCFAPEKLNVKTVLNSDLLNDKSFYSKLKRTRVIEKNTKKNDSYYLDLLITNINNLITHIKDFYNIIQE